jgi:hypothetical protein
VVVVVMVAVRSLLVLVNTVQALSAVIPSVEDSKGMAAEVKV